jgi:hypothetical protein
VLEKQLLPDVALKPTYSNVFWLYVYRDFSNSVEDRAAERTSLRFGLISWPEPNAKNGADDQSVKFVVLRIAQVGDKVVYFASPGGRPPTPFTLITLEKYHAVFESKRNDFPQRIIYTRHGDAVVARIEGKSVGKEKAIEWRWHRGEPQDP